MDVGRLLADEAEERLFVLADRSVLRDAAGKPFCLLVSDGFGRSPFGLEGAVACGPDTFRIGVAQYARRAFCTAEHAANEVGDFLGRLVKPSLPQRLLASERAMARCGHRYVGDGLDKKLVPGRVIAGANSRVVDVEQNFGFRTRDGNAARPATSVEDAAHEVG